jgi:hypothetical protein
MLIAVTRTALLAASLKEIAEPPTISTVITRG